MDFSEIPGAYLDKKMSDLGNRYNGVADLMSGDSNAWANQFGVGDQANVKPVSTTINYGDNGQQTVTTKHEVTPPAMPSYLSQQPAPINTGVPGLGATPAPQPTFNFMPQGGHHHRLCNNLQWINHHRVWVNLQWVCHHKVCNLQRHQ